MKLRKSLLWCALLLASASLAGAWLVRSSGGAALAVANVPALFGEFDRRPNIAYGTRSRQRLDVYVPWYAKQRPVVVFWHGGGWNSGDKAHYRFVGAALARAGYVAVLPNYRLYPEVRYPHFMFDAANALAWVVSHAADIGGDPRRIFVAGHSAGAHIAALLAVDSELLEAHAIPPSAVRGLIGLSGPYALMPDSPIYHAIFAAPYTPSEWQPVQKVRPGAPPALLLHGGADRTVPPRHAHAMAAALESVDATFTMRIYPDREHVDTVASLALPARRKLPIMQDIRRFIDEN